MSFDVLRMMKQMQKDITDIKRGIADIMHVLKGDDFGNEGIVKRFGVIEEYTDTLRKEKVLHKTNEMYREYDRLQWVVKNLAWIVGLIGVSGLANMIDLLSQIIRKI